MTQPEDMRDRATKPTRYNFRILLGNGSFVDLAKQLSNPQVVLPFLYSVLGAPLAFAGLIVPMNKVGDLFGRAVSAPLISKARFSKRYMAFGSLVVGIFLMALAIFVQIIQPNAVAVIFLLVAGAIGVGQGLSNVAFQNVLGHAIPQERRGRLLFTQTAVGGALAIAAASATIPLFKNAKPLDSHITLVWISAVVLVLAFVFSLLVREAPANTDASSGARGFTSEIHRAFTLVGQAPWFRRFLVVQVLFLSVALATTFYSIHAASLHGEKSGSLSVFVIASSLGFVVGGPLWSWVLDKGVRPVFILGGLATMSAAILALIIEYVASLQSVLLHAPVFLLATLGYQAVTQGRQIYVVNMTTDEERPFFISISQTLLQALSIGVAALFGVLAHVNGEAWPLLVILAMNTIAVLYVFALPSVEEAARVRGRIS
jgi:MFS family permease